jgi:hypothetical protein
MLLQQAPRLSPPGPSASAAVVERVAADLVRRCWVQADSRSGRVRLELGGAHHGTVVELVFDGNAGQLDVDVEMAEDAAAGTERFLRGLGARLRDKGLPLGAFEVRGVKSS